MLNGIFQRIETYIEKKLKIFNSITQSIMTYRAEARKMNLNFQTVILQIEINFLKLWPAIRSLRKKKKNYGDRRKINSRKETIYDFLEYKNDHNMGKC